MKRVRALAATSLCLAVAAYAAVAYGLYRPGELVHPAMRANFEANALAVRLHVFSALLALALGPLQFSPQVRSRWPHAHRLAGRIYLSVGVGFGGASGLYLAQFAHGGAVARWGFSLLALAWLFTGARALVAVRSRDFVRHREWMMRNFSLTFAAVTLRLYLPISLVGGVPFEAAYQVVAWLCWVPNLLLAQVWIVSRRAHAGFGMPALGRS